MNPRTRDSFYMLWTLAILICLAMCVFLLAYVSIVGGGAPAAETTSPQTEAGTTETLPDGSQAPVDGSQVPADGSQAAADGSQAPAEVTPVPLVEFTGPTVLPETMDIGQEYVDKLVFLGDSTTLGLQTYGVLPQTQVWVPSNGTLSLFNWATENVMYYDPAAPDVAQSLSIPVAAATRQPEFLVITLGVNGVTLLDETAFKDYYRGLVQAIRQASPGTKVICQSIYPVIDGKAPEGVTNAIIDTANTWILSVAEETGVRFLDSNGSLKDDSGNLNSSYESGDGMHLLPDGYQAILQYARTHAWL